LLQNPPVKIYRFQYNITRFKLQCTIDVSIIIGSYIFCQFYNYDVGVKSPQL